MTKKEKELLWRLKDLPTGKEIAELVAQKVITTIEARELLFTEKRRIELKEPQKLKELQDEVRFLRQLVDTLASTRRGGWRLVETEYQRYTPLYPTSTYWINCGTAITSASNTLGTSVSTGTVAVLSAIK